MPHILSIILAALTSAALLLLFAGLIIVITALRERQRDWLDRYLRRRRRR